MGSFTGHGRCGGYTTNSIDHAFYLEHGWARIPTVIQLMVTTGCPMTCPHCLADDGSPGTDATAEVIDAVLGEVVEAGIDELLITGGEPLARADLPALVEELRVREISWSLNTAWSPDAEQRRAIEAHPPGFVAVSLDGPAPLHDRFRGIVGAHARALEAIRWFSSLEGCTVTAGTSVTRRNVRHLERTLHEVASSGAEAWGLHLLVPEGRAAERNDLALRRKDLDGILRFTARRRSVFPISMADELGYCGEWEPLVRDLPLGCGAGRAMCVVLPDGEVVPCTTMDRSVSAGNVLDRPLMEIWTEGFRELRAWAPEGRCEGCGYAAACQGGCWLHRRSGAQCYKDVWQIPGAMKTAASVAVCLGMLGTSNPTVGGPCRADSGRHAPPTGQTTPSPGASLESMILQWYGEQIPKIEFGRHYPELPDLTPTLPASAAPPGPLGFVGMVRTGTLPADPGERLALVKHMAGTSHGSLAFSALLLRTATEAALDGPPLRERPGALSDALGEVLQTINTKTAALRERIFAEKLDPYLARGRLPLRHRFEMSKAYRPPPGWLRLERDTATERWGEPSEAAPEVTRDYLDRHPWGEHLTISFRSRKGFPESSGSGADTFQTFSPFDTLQVPKSGRRAPGSDSPSAELRLIGTDETLLVTLPAGATLTWPDLLQAAWTQHRDTLLEHVDTFEKVDFLTPKDPLLLPAVMERVGGDATGREGRVESLGLWLADFWLF